MATVAYFTLRMTRVTHDRPNQPFNQTLLVFPIDVAEGHLVRAYNFKSGQRVQSVNNNNFSSCYQLYLRPSAINEGNT